MSNELKAVTDTILTHKIANHQVVPTSGYVQTGDCDYAVGTATITSVELFARSEPNPETFLYMSSDKDWTVIQNDFIIRMKVDLPGCEKKKVKVIITPNEILVTGRRSDDSATRHLSHRLFHEASVENVSATLVDGVLTVDFPRVRRTEYINVNVK